MTRFIKIICVLFSCAAISVWWFIFNTSSSLDPELFFLPVGQGDAQLVRMGPARMLIDGGPNRSVVDALDTILGAGAYLDVIFISHGQADHITGLFDVISSRSVGTIIYQGEITPLLSELFVRAESLHIPVVRIDVLSTVSYNGFSFTVLSSGQTTSSSNAVNDDSLVLRFDAHHACALFTADIGFAMEKELLMRYGDQLNCDVLKVAHHGSKTSSLGEFLNRVSPQVSVIEVGKNSYGHPTAEVLARLTQVGSRIFRTDQEGIVKIVFQDGLLRVSSASIHTR